MLRASLLLALGSVLTQSIIAQKCEYEAPYNLGSTPTLTASSGLKINNAVYYIQACGSVNASYCPDSDDTQQECFAYTDNDGKEHSYSLGTSKNTSWYANGDSGEWVKGAVSYTSDITIGTTDLLCNAKKSSNFTTIYTCETGLDTVKVLNEPATNEDGCDFLFKVDSSIVCKYQQSLISSSSSSSSTGESSSSVESSSSSRVESSSSSVESSSSERSSSSGVSSSSAVSSSSSGAPVSSSSSATGRSSPSVVSSSSGASSSSVPVVSSSSEHPANSSSTGGWLSSSSSEVPISSSSSEPVVISSSSSEPDTSSSTGDDSSSTGADSGGMSATEQLAIGLGAGLGGLVLVLLVALCVVVRKLQAATSGKTSLIDEESSSGRYNTLKNTEEGRGKKSKNERL